MRLRLYVANTRIAGPDSSKKEINASWAIFILIVLLLIAFFTSYLLQQKKVTAIHETVISIFAGATSHLRPVPPNLQTTNQDI